MYGGVGGVSASLASVAAAEQTQAPQAGAGAGTLQSNAGVLVGAGSQGGQSQGGGGGGEEGGVGINAITYRVRQGAESHEKAVLMPGVIG